MARKRTTLTDEVLAVAGGGLMALTAPVAPNETIAVAGGKSTGAEWLADELARQHANGATEARIETRADGTLVLLVPEPQDYHGRQLRDAKQSLKGRRRGHGSG